MPPGLEPGSSIYGLACPQDYPVLVEAIRERGWNDDDIDAVTHKSLLRFLRTSQPA